jgi:hypothetical protein
VPTDATFCPGCGRRFVTQAKAQRQPQSAQPGCGCSLTVLRWAGAIVLAILAVVSVASGFENAKSQGHHESYTIGPQQQAVQIHCQGAKQDGGPGADQGTFDSVCAQTASTSNGYRPLWFALGALSALGAGFLFFDIRRRVART